MYCKRTLRQGLLLHLRDSVSSERTEHYMEQKQVHEGLS